MEKDGPIGKIVSELEEASALKKCLRCGCMKEALENILSLRPLSATFPPDFFNKVQDWSSRMLPVAYPCLGCKHCYSAVAINILNEAFPEAASKSPTCSFEVKEAWPPIPGEYIVLCSGGDCPVAVSTLGSLDLVEKLSLIKPKELCIVGKTETENIGIDKVIKNTITNPAIRVLLVCGKDTEGHKPGKTLLSLHENGVDEKMRIVGSTGRNPILRNVSRQEVDIFRQQVKMIDLIGCEDEDKIVQMIKKSAKEGSSPCSCTERGNESIDDSTPPRIVITKDDEKDSVIMDRAGYFVIIPQQKEKLITIEHYSYRNDLLRTFVGSDAKSIWKAIVKSGYVTQLSHAAYLGAELEKAELSLKYGFNCVQDGA